MRLFQRLLVAVLATVLLSIPVLAADTPAPDYAQKLSNATVAVYQAKQICQWKSEPGFFGLDWNWKCGFENKFICTGTTIKTDGRATYLGLTAGHCFEWEHLDEYYVSDSLDLTPVLRHVKIEKFEFNAKYDYAIFSFSGRPHEVLEPDYDNPDLPVIGTEVVNVNFSLGIAKQLLEGKVVSGQIPKTKESDWIANRYLVTVGIGPGASGSAIVDKKTGKIVGMVEAIFTGTQMASVVIPTNSLLRDFVLDDSVGIKPQPESGSPPVEKVNIPEIGTETLWHHMFRVFMDWFWKN